jgi:predicted dehydrogenase
VIGVGVGSAHVHAFDRHPETDLVAVCDLNPQVLERVYERAGIARDGVQVFTDYQEMLARCELDVVGVATPDQYHAGPVVAAVEAGVRGIICEKPLASTLADADRIVDAVESRGVAFLVDHTRNFEPAYTGALERVQAGDIGRLTRIVAYLGGRRAMLFRNATHLLGAVRLFAGGAPRWVIAALDNGFEDYGTTYHGEGGKDPALDPGSSLIIDFAGGAGQSGGVRALVMASKETPQTGVELDLLGTRGRIRVSDGGTHYWQAKADEGSLEERPVTWPVGIHGDLGARLAPAVTQLVDLVRQGSAGAPPAEGAGGAGNSPARAARDVLEIMIGALQSQARGMVPVTLPLPRE